MKKIIFIISILFQIFFVKDKIDGEIVHAHGFPANIFISFMKKLGLLKNKKIIFNYQQKYFKYSILENNLLDW